MASHRFSSPLAVALLAGSAGLVLPSLPARAQGINLVTNGSFAYSNIGPIGWTFLRPGGESWHSFGFTPSPDGADYFGIQDLDAFTSRFNVEGITQNVAGLQVGQTYQLRFYSMSNHTNQNANARQQWRVSFGGETQFSQQTFSSATANWVQSTLNFTATATTQALTFVAEFLPGSYPEILNIDGIVLTAATVPEPDVAWLLSSGLLAMGFLARRRMR